MAERAVVQQPAGTGTLRFPRTEALDLDSDIASESRKIAPGENLRRTERIFTILCRMAASFR